MLDVPVGKDPARRYRHAREHRRPPSMGIARTGSRRRGDCDIILANLTEVITTCLSDSGSRTP
jgi:hypothetical protein